MDDKSLLPGQWIDSLNWDALHTVADVEEVMRKVRELQGARIIKKLRTGAYYSHDLATQ
jgi:hypothetical protein